MAQARKTASKKAETLDLEPVDGGQKSGQQLARAQDTPSPAETGLGVNRVVDLIERVLADRETPLERVEQAISLYQRVVDDAEARAKREAEIAYAKALPAMQADLPVIRRRGTGNNKNKYARWEDIGPAVLPVLKKHGFSIEFPTQVGDGKITMRCRLRHVDGHFEDGEPFEAPADTSGNKNVIQSLGSSTTYIKRYTAGLKLNLIFEDEVDDDGAGASGYIDEDQIETLRSLASETAADLGSLFKYAGAESWETIPAGKYTKIRGMLLRKKSEMESI